MSLAGLTEGYGWLHTGDLGYVDERVAAVYQRVHTVVIMEDFPRSVAGKTLKRVMREPYWAEQGTRI